MRVSAFLLLLVISGCTTFGTNQRHEFDMKEGKKEVTTSASKTDLQTETTKPLVDATGSHGTTITLDIKGDLPEEKSSGKQLKEASEDSIFSMTIEETWEQFSGWVYLIIAVAMATAVKALKSLETTKTFTSVSGGLRVFGSVLDVLDSKLRDMAPGSSEYETLRATREAIKGKESSLQKKAKPS